VTLGLGGIGLNAHCLSANTLFIKIRLPKDMGALERAFIVYVRPMVEYNSSLLSPLHKSDVETIESVQKITKRSSLQA